jgi:hypothetical protein
MFAKAIVTSDAGGILEVVTPDHDALVAPAGDPAALTRALRRAIQDRELRATLAGNARRTYEHRYEAKAVALQMLGFVEQIRQDRPRVRLHRRRNVKTELRWLLQAALWLPLEQAARTANELLD